MSGKGALLGDLFLPPTQPTAETTLGELFRRHSSGLGTFPGGIDGNGKTLYDLLPPSKPLPPNAFGLASLSDSLNSPGLGAFSGGIVGNGKTLYDLLPPSTPLPPNAFGLASLSDSLNGFGVNSTGTSTPNAYLEALAGLSAFNQPAPPAPQQWIAVGRRFREFHEALAPTEDHQQDVRKKAAGIIGCLNRAYYGIQNDYDHGFYVGSWGKGTAIYPHSDLDLFYVVPYETYLQFEKVESNRQSRLLQHVKNALVGKYSRTDISADGQVVVVEFDKLKVEVVPAILLKQPERYWICNTSGGGSYRYTAPIEEQRYISKKDSENGNNVRPLSRMLKAWRYNCNVPIQAFHLEMMAVAFLEQSKWRLNGWVYFDWIIRDFFEFMPKFKDQYLVMPGTDTRVGVGSAWVTYANTAHGRAVHASEYEKTNRVFTAGLEWQKIFGTAIPRE